MAALISRIQQVTCSPWKAYLVLKAASYGTLDACCLSDDVASHARFRVSVWGLVGYGYVSLRFYCRFCRSRTVGWGSTRCLRREVDRPFS